MPAIPSGDLTLLRAEGHRSDIYASFLKPLSLHTSRVNASPSRGAQSIAFDGGAGSHYAAVEAGQTLWVGSTPGAVDFGRVRIQSVTSGDAGVTGTYTVDPNTIVWINNLYLTTKHNYELWPWYPYINPSTEVFYKNRTLAYTDQNTNVSPVVIANIWPRAQFIRNGEAVFWVDASDSYAIKNGETISSYSLTAYPTTGVTVTFNSGTGVGYVVATSLTQEYYWLKFTVTDSNGESQSAYHCIYAHNPDRTGSTFPHIDFQVNQLVGAWDRGGWYAQLMLHDNSSLADVPDETFSVLWKESYWGIDAKLPTLIRDGNRLYVNPKLSYTITPSGANCDVDVTFHAGILDDGASVSNGTAVSVDISIVGGGGPTNVNGTTTDSQVSLNTTLNGVACTDTIEVENAGNTITIITEDYTSGAIVSNDSEWPSELFVFPRNMIVGYLRRDHLTTNLAPDRGIQQNQVDITTIEDVLRNHFMFSISLAARPDGSVNRWYEYAKELTIGRAAHHIWRWHSTLMSIANVYGLTDNTDGRAYAEFEGGSLYTMPDEMARQAGIRAHLVCNKSGDLHLTQDAQLLPDTPRAALTTIANVTDDDVGGEIGILRNPENRVALVYASGIVYNEIFSADSRGIQMPDLSPYCAIAPTTLPGIDGEGTIDLDRQVITSQNHVNQLAGRVFAQVNNEYPEFRIPYHGDYLDVLDVHLAEFWEMDIVASDTLREIVLSNQLLIPRQVNVQVKSGDGGNTITTSVVFEPEQDGYDGVSTSCFTDMPVLAGTPVLPSLGSLLAGTIVTSSD
jgi:hypothetical protein